jgi:hypothetical protein
MRITLGFLVLVACGSGSSQPTDGGGDDGGASDAIATPNDGGSLDVTAPSDGATPTSCKRGIAANAVPTNAFTQTAPGISWWYDWSNTLPPNNVVDFVPMIWGAKNLAGPIPQSAKFLLGFNEPNFKAQSNLTPQQAAADWPQVEALAKPLAIPLVSPAVNFCGSAQNTTGCSDPNVTDPYTWLKNFFTACTNCQVDAIAVHWYNCDLPSLKAYIEGNGSLEGFVQFNKPIWLTEFSCDGSHSAADQKTYMQAAIPYLEGNAHVARYAWFDATPIASAVLQNTDGTLTDLGQTYVSLPQSCP